MAHLYTSLVLLCFFSSVWPSDWMIHFTHLGTKCTGDCKLVGHEYKCKSTDKNGKVQTMFCSPKTKKDYWDRRCDNKCRKYGEEYYWCSPHPFSWGYCGLVTDKNIYYGSKTGAMCYDNCYRRDQDNYWCNTAQGKDHCSPYENRDYNNRQCKEDSPCGKRDENYNWCYLKQRGWTYCGLVEPKMFFHRSKYDNFCLDECQYYESGDYYWCHTDDSDGWDYCSPDVDVTYRDKPCRSDHFCDTHGEYYNWCWTSDSDYDYCGPIESGECTSQKHNRGDLKDRKLTCTQVDRGNKNITTFTAEPAEKACIGITDGSKWKSEAEILIRRWDNAYLVDKVQSNLIHSNNLRIDMKGIIKRNNQSYYDLQIHLKQGPGKSIIMSQIIVPRGIPERYMRKAFLESFRHQARVYVDISRQNN